MNRPAFAILLTMAFTGLGYGKASHAQIETSYPDLPSGSRLMGFRIRLVGGQVASMRNVPAGWRFTIDNDPSWKSTVSGHAIVGAAAMAGRDLARLFTVEPPPASVVHDLHTRLSASGSVTFLRSGRLVTRPLGAIEFDTSTAASQ